MFSTLTGEYWGCRFNLEDMVALNGNTAVYMLYAHARIASIVRKVGKDVNEVAKTAQITLEHPAEVRAPRQHPVRVRVRKSMALQLPLCT